MKGHPAEYGHFGHVPCKNMLRLCLMGQNAKNLTASKCFPLFPHERTLPGAVGTAEKCHKQIVSAHPHNNRDSSGQPH
jgi:hypothetical protein